MDPNPWQSEVGQGNNNEYADHSRTNYQAQESQHQPHSTSFQQPHLSYQPHQPGYQQPEEDWTRQDPTDNPWGSNTSSQPYQPPTRSYEPPQGSQYESYQPQTDSYLQSHSQPLTLPLRRSDTDDLLEAQEDRAEQVEHLQQYEASKILSDDDRNQEQLQKQFPGIDSSLIAAIYNDYKQGAGRVDMAQIREMLQELQS